MGLFRTDGKDKSLEDLQKESDTLQKDSLKLQRKQEVKNEKLTRQQFEEKSRLEDEQAHGSLSDELEDSAIVIGQKLGLSQKTTTGFAMGAQDAKVNLFSSNEDIVEYYKNYDANREKKQQQVASVYSRELSQEQTAEKLTLSEKQSKQTYKQSKKTLKNTTDTNEAERAAKKAGERADKADSVLGKVASGIKTKVEEYFTLD